MELEKVVKERDELKVKIEKWEESSKSLNKILNSQMSANDKNGLDEYAIRKKIIESKTDTSKSKTSETVGFQNPFYLKKAQQLEPKLYDGNVIKNTSTIVIPEFEETLMLAPESYVVLNQLSQDFGKQFVP
ncbi:hypothetical protein Tco_1327848 [Tanacetum coccineum]